MCLSKIADCAKNIRLKCTFGAFLEKYTGDYKKLPHPALDVKRFEDSKSVYLHPQYCCGGVSSSIINFTLLFCKAFTKEKGFSFSIKSQF